MIRQQFNPLNQVVQSDDGRGARRYEYDENDNLDVLHERDGRIFTYEYDSLDLLRTLREETTTASRTITYWSAKGVRTQRLTRSPLGHEVVTRPMRVAAARPDARWSKPG